MKAFVLFSAGLLFAFPANSETPSESSTASAQPLDPSIVKPKAIGRHVCLDGMANWVHSTSSNHVMIVHVEFKIVSDGTVSDVVVTPSSGNADLDRTTVLCVQRWRYEPATKDGKPIDIPWYANVSYWHQ